MIKIYLYVFAIRLSALFPVAYGKLLPYRSCLYVKSKLLQIHGWDDAYLLSSFEFTFSIMKKGLFLNIAYFMWFSLSLLHENWEPHYIMKFRTDRSLVLERARWQKSYLWQLPDFPKLSKQKLKTYAEEPNSKTSIWFNKTPPMIPESLEL